jgi:hypothetical protein
MRSCVLSLPSSFCTLAKIALIAGQMAVQDVNMKFSMTGIQKFLQDDRLAVLVNHGHCRNRVGSQRTLEAGRDCMVFVSIMMMCMMSVCVRRVSLNLFGHGRLRLEQQFQRQCAQDCPEQGPGVQKRAK